MSFKRLLLAFVAIAMVVIACEKQPKPTPPKPTPPTPTTVKVTGVSLNKSSHEMAEGESITLTATVAPSDATNKKVSWSSSNNAITTVNPEGKVTAVSVGEAIITATSQDGNHTASCTLTVESNSVDVYMSVTNIVSIYKNGVAMKDLPYKSLCNI